MHFCVCVCVSMQQTSGGHGTHDDSIRTIIRMYGSRSACVLVRVRSIPLGRTCLLLSTYSNVADERLADAVNRSKRFIAIQQIRICCRMAVTRMHRTIFVFQCTVGPGDTMA